MSTRDPVMLEAIAKAGGPARVAAACRITVGAVSQWLRVPANRVLVLERLSGVRRERLRPDLYPSEEAPRHARDSARPRADAQPELIRGDRRTRHLPLEAAFRRLVETLGGLDAAATCCRLGRSQLAAAYAPHETGTWPPADVIADLEAAAGAPLVTAELARLAGCRLLPDEIRAEPDALILPRLGALLREAGTVAPDGAEALADGVLSDRERADLLAGCAAIERVVAGVRAACGRAEQDR